MPGCCVFKEHHPIFASSMSTKIKFEDTLRHQAMRRQLLQTLRTKGIQDEKVLEAMMQVPRHFFLDPALEHIAYEDRAFPIAAGQTISQPYTVAYQTQLLEIQRYDRVLEIGTGSAYQAMVLAELGVRVFTIERQRDLYRHREEHQPFAQKYKSIKYFYGDGFLGLPTYAPFQKVLVTAAAPYVPQPLLDQLQAGGMLVIPVNEGDAQRMKRIRKMPDGSLQEEILDIFRFVPMLEGKQG